MTAILQEWAAVSRGDLRTAESKLEAANTATTRQQQGRLGTTASAGGNNHGTGGGTRTLGLGLPTEATGGGATAEDYELSLTRPADVLWTPTDLSHGDLTEVEKGRVWVVPEVLSARECDEWLCRSLPPGPNSPLKAPPCRGKRTQNIESPDVSSVVESRLPSQLLEQLRGTSPGTEVRGVHPAWKVHRYTQGGSYCAHYDQDSFRTLPFSVALGYRERETSSHTLLISLSPQSEYSGGGTRFWLDNTYDGATAEVHLPVGSALVFQQHGTLHNEMPLVHGVKYTAQTGLLRAQPSGPLKPAVFKWGPGLGCAYQVR